MGRSGRKRKPSTPWVPPLLLNVSSASVTHTSTPVLGQEYTNDTSIGKGGCRWILISQIIHQLTFRSNECHESYCEVRVTGSPVSCLPPKFLWRGYLVRFKRNSHLRLVTVVNILTRYSRRVPNDWSSSSIGMRLWTEPSCPPSFVTYLFRPDSHPHLRKIPTTWTRVSWRIVSWWTEKEDGWGPNENIPSFRLEQGDR